MLYYRKYLHVELIGSRVCSLLRLSCVENHEIAVSLGREPLQLQKYKRDYTERYLEGVSNANETRKECTWSRARDENEEGDFAVCNSVSRPTPKEHSVRIMPPQSQISLCCPNSAAEAAGISYERALFRELSCPGVPSHLYPDAIPTYSAFTYVRVHVNIRVARPPNHG